MTSLRQLSMKTTPSTSSNIITSQELLPHCWYIEHSPDDDPDEVFFIDNITSENITYTSVDLSEDGFISYDHTSLEFYTYTLVTTKPLTTEEFIDVYPELFI